HRHLDRFRSRPAALSRPPRGRPNDSLRHPVYLGAHPGLYGALRVSQRPLHRAVFQPLDGRGRDGVGRAGADGRVLMVVYVPLLQPFFDTVPLTLDDWLLMLPFFFASPIAMELVKLYFRRRIGGARG